MANPKSFTGRPKISLSLNHSVSGAVVTWSLTMYETESQPTSNGFAYENTFSYNFSAGGGPSASGQQFTYDFSPSGLQTKTLASGSFTATASYFVATATATGTSAQIGTASVDQAIYPNLPPPPNPAPSFSGQDQTITTTWIKTINFSAAPDRTVAASNASGYSIVASGTGLSPTAWLTINSSGQLSGVPTAVGVYTFLIRASGAGGTADSSLKTLTVNPPGNRSNGTNMATDLVIGKRYDGTQWVNIGTFKRYNGTAWVDIVN